MSYQDQEITLIPTEGSTHSVPFKYAMLSETIKALTYFPTEIDEQEEWELPQDPLPLPAVSEQTLRQIIEYCKYHVDNVETTKQERDLWDAEYMKMDDKELFKLIIASNYLDIQSLLYLGCETVANIIKATHSPEEIRRRFKINNAAPPEADV